MRETFLGRMGTMTIDFDKGTVTLERSGKLAELAQQPSMMFRIAEITDIELRKPSFTKLGGCTFIINGIRYVNNAGFDSTQFAISQKADFPRLDKVLSGVLSLNGIASFSSEGSVNAPKQVYN